MFINFGEHIINLDNVSYVKRKDTVNRKRDKQYDLYIYGFNIDMTLCFEEVYDRDLVYNLLVKFMKPRTIDLTAIKVTCHA